jgi:hypothetical protein
LLLYIAEFVVVEIAISLIHIDIVGHNILSDGVYFANLLDQIEIAATETDITLFVLFPLKSQDNVH